MIADMHCDTLAVINSEKKKGKALPLRDGAGLMVNLEKMKKGDYLFQNFAVFIDLQEEGDPFDHAMELVDIFEQEMAQNQDLIRQAVNCREVEENRRNGKLSAVLTLEDGGMCRGEIEKLHDFYKKGARMMTLTWNYENELGYPAALEPEQGDCRPDPSFGLKKRGFEFLEEMEAMGMIIDVSHLSDAGFYDVCDFCRNPFVASHSDARSVFGCRRNLTDTMLHMLGEKGGVAGLNFYPVFLGQEEPPTGCLDAICRHALHMADCAGMESVGLGTDFDGFAETSHPADGAQMDDLAFALHKAGFTERETEGILYRNVMRLYREVLK